MNLFELYDKYLISPLEKEIKLLKRNKNNTKIINRLYKLLFLYYKKYYEKSNEIR